jgi:hypothetical protein
MNDILPGRRMFCALVAIAAAALSTPVAAQQEDVTARVVTRQQATIAQRATDPLDDWQTEYANALEAARRLQQARDTRELGERLELELGELDEALHAYARVAERLRHKDRAVAATLDELPASPGSTSNVSNAVANALAAGHEAVKNMVNNIR